MTSELVRFHDPLGMTFEICERSFRQDSAVLSWRTHEVPLTFPQEVVAEAVGVPDGQLSCASRRRSSLVALRVADAKNTEASNISRRERRLVDGLDQREAQKCVRRTHGEVLFEIRDGLKAVPLSVLRGELEAVVDLRRRKLVDDSVLVLRRLDSIQDFVRLFCVFVKGERSAQVLRIAAEGTY